MPSSQKHNTWGYSTAKYRVKLGNKTIHECDNKGDAKDFIRKHAMKSKLKLILPNI